MADTQVVGIAFGQGQDTKTDPKVTSKPTLIQDGIFTNPKRISKRNGYNALTQNLFGGYVFDQVYMVKSYRNELVAAAHSVTNGNRLFGYSSTESAWVDKGKYVSVGTSKQLISAPSYSFGGHNSSCVINGNVALYSYDSWSAVSTPSASYIIVIDQITGTYLLSDTQITNAVGYARSVVLGSSTLAVFYAKTGTSLCMRVITVTLGGGVTIGSEVVLATDITPTMYDVVNIPSGGAMVAWSANGSTSIKTKTVDNAGVTVDSATISSAPNASPISVTRDAAGNFWIYWVDSTTITSETIYYTIRSSTLTNVLSKTSIKASVSRINQLTSNIESSTVQTLYFSDWQIATSPNAIIYPTVNKVSVQLGGTVGSSSVFLKSAGIYSRPVTVGASTYLGCILLSSYQATGFLVDTSMDTANPNAIAVAKFLPSEAEGIYYDTAQYGMRYSGYLTSFNSLSSSKVQLCAGIQTYVGDQTNTYTSGGSPGVSILTNSVRMGVSSITFDFSHIDAYQGLLSGDALILNGAIVSQYDGGSVTELNFNNFPGLFVTQSASGSPIGAGNYTYWAVYELYDSNGNLHQSTPSIPVLIAVAGGNAVSVKAQSLAITQKSGVVIAIYRSTTNGSIGYRIGQINNDPTASEQTLTDTFSDALIQTNQQLYTAGGAVIENTPPPPSLSLWANYNRVWCIDSENPQTTIEYSKTISKGSGISFSTGLLELIVDSRFGNIIAGLAMDEKTLLLKSDGALYFIGDGANDSGFGSSITNPQIIPSDVGCVNSKSVILIPAGAVFKSTKGIYIVSRGAQVSYFGYDVEAYNQQDVQSALIVPDKNQVRFLTSSGSSLLYDYAMNQWSVFTNHTGYSATNYGGLYVYARTDGFVYQENTSSFLDNASSYYLQATIQWIKASATQDFYRIKRIELLGDYQNGSQSGHGVQISQAYDFGTSFTQPVAYLFGQSSTSGSFQYRERLSRQKCDAIQLVIQEIVTGASGEFIDITDLGIEISAKRGLNKLPATRSVG